MNSYETIVVLKPDVKEEEKEKTINKIGEIITSNEGQIAQINKWGIKRMEYEVKGYREGFYVYVKFSGPGKLVALLNKNYLVTDTVIRFLTTRGKADISTSLETKPVTEITNPVQSSGSQIDSSQKG